MMSASFYAKIASVHTLILEIIIWCQRSLDTQTDGFWALYRCMYSMDPCMLAENLHTQAATDCSLVNLSYLWLTTIYFKYIT